MIKQLSFYQLDQSECCFYQRPEFWSIYYPDEKTCLEQSFLHIKEYATTHNVKFDVWELGCKNLNEYKVGNLAFEITNNIIIHANLLERKRSGFVNKTIKGEDGILYDCNVAVHHDWKESDEIIQPLIVSTQKSIVKIFE